MWLTFLVLANISKQQTLCCHLPSSSPLPSHSLFPPHLPPVFPTPPLPKHLTFRGTWTARPVQCPPIALEPRFVAKNSPGRDRRSLFIPETKSPPFIMQGYTSTSLYQKCDLLSNNLCMSQHNHFVQNPKYCFSRFIFFLFFAIPRVGRRQNVCLNTNDLKHSLSLSFSLV